MEALQSNDPAFLETCHRWLLFHYHCNDCGQSKDTCEYGKVCSYGKSTFMHVQGCARNECAFPRCDLIKAILRHHQACKDETCQLCSPVYKYQARSKGPKPQPHSPFMGEAPSPVSTAKLPQPQQSMPVQIPETVRGNTCRDINPNRTQSLPLPEQPPLHQPHHAGMLFEARHREQCQLSSSLRRSSWTPDATASESGGGCTLANAPSGSLEAAAGLQRLHLEKLPQQQQQQQCTASSSRVSPPPQPSSPQPTATSLQHTASSNNCLDMASSRSDLSTPVGCVSRQEPPQPLGLIRPGSGQIIADLGTQQQIPQETARPLIIRDQQKGTIYGANSLAVLLQAPQQQIQQQSVAVAHALQQPHNASLPHSQQQQQQQVIGWQPQSPLSLAPHAVIAPSPPQHFGVAPQALAGRGGCLPGPGTAFVHASTSPNPTQQYGTYMQNLHQNQQFPRQATAGVPFAMISPQYYGSAVDQANRAVLSQLQQQQQSQQQVQFQHPHMQLMQGQLQASGLVVGSVPQVPAGSGLFMTPAAVAGVPTAVAPSSGLVATDNGAGPGAAALWGTFQLSGLPPPQVVQAHQQLQQLQGHFPAGNYGNTATSVLLPPQLTGAS